MKKKSIACAAILASASVATASVIDFDDLAVPPGGYENGANLNGSFVSQGATFNNYFDDTYRPYWEGFAYSNQHDTTTAGFGNQYSSFAGGGSDANGNAQPGNNFAVGFVGFTVPTITLPSGESRPLSIEVTNTTYTALSMRDGDSFAKKFGGASGNDPDFLELIITALDAQNSVVGSKDVYLADYRFADNSQDYILNSWTEVDLSSFGDDVSHLKFTLASSDIGRFGIDTPTYFAIDNLVVVPEPQSLALVLAGFIAFGFCRKKNDL